MSKPPIFSVLSILDEAGNICLYFSLIVSLVVEFWGPQLRVKKREETMKKQALIITTTKRKGHREEVIPNLKYPIPYQLVSSIVNIGIPSFVTPFS